MSYNEEYKNRSTAKRHLTRVYSQKELDDVALLIKKYCEVELPGESINTNSAYFSDLADAINDSRFGGNESIKAKYLSEIYNGINNSKKKSIEKMTNIKAFLDDWLGLHQGNKKEQLAEGKGSALSDWNAKTNTSTPQWADYVSLPLDLLINIEKKITQLEALQQNHLDTKTQQQIEQLTEEREVLRKKLLNSDCQISFTSHSDGSMITAYPTVIEGSASLYIGGHLWILAHLKGYDGWWPQGNKERIVNGNKWTCPVYLGNGDQIGEFEIAAVIVNDEENFNLINWVNTAQQNNYPPIRFPSLNKGRYVAIISVNKQMS